MTRLADIKYSTLDLVPVRQDSGPAQSLRNSLDLAQHVEKFGYNRFWVAEHHNMDGIASSATSVLLGYLAGGTSTIRDGVAVRPLNSNSSMSAATAAQLWFIASAKGRVARFQTNSPVCSMLFRLSLRPTLQKPMIGGM